MRAFDVNRRDRQKNKERAIQFSLPLLRRTECSWVPLRSRLLRSSAVPLSCPSRFTSPFPEELLFPRCSFVLKKYRRVAPYENTPADIAETNSLGSKQGKDFYHLYWIYSKNSLLSSVIFPYSVEYSIKPSLKLAITFNEN